MIPQSSLLIYTHASVRKFFLAAGIGLPLEFLQQGGEVEPINREPDEKGRVQFLITGPTFYRVGSRIDQKSTVLLEAFVKTKMIETDIYYHQRIKGRTVEAVAKTIPLLKVGGKPEDGFDKTQVGILRPCPMESLEVQPVSVVEPYGSAIIQLYELELC